MEKSKPSPLKKLEPIKKKENLGEKIDKLWKPAKPPKYENKKLVVKLETNGNGDKQKILLKLESGTAKVHSKNYGLISELMKQFFSDSGN